MRNGGEGERRRRERLEEECEGKGMFGGRETVREGRRREIERERKMEEGRKSCGGKR